MVSFWWGIDFFCTHFDVIVIRENILCKKRQQKKKHINVIKIRKIFLHFNCYAKYVETIAVSIEQIYFLKISKENFGNMSVE